MAIEWPEAKMRESFEGAFTQYGTCRATCQCGAEYYDPYGSHDWEEGELEDLTADADARAKPDIRVISVFGREFVSGCGCLWEGDMGRRANALADFLIDNIWRYRSFVLDYREFLDAERAMVSAGIDAISGPACIPLESSYWSSPEERPPTRPRWVMALVGSRQDGRRVEVARFDARSEMWATREKGGDYRELRDVVGWRPLPEEDDIRLNGTVESYINFDAALEDPEYTISEWSRRRMNMETGDRYCDWVLKMKGKE